jgi:glycosyltransferase involved in cell wall biosynthesis
MGRDFSGTLLILRRLLIGLDWVVALAWAMRTVQWLRGMGRVPDLTQAAYAPDDNDLRSKVSVIVPACNEAPAIESCLRSLLGSRGLQLEILAVDDRSTDATGRIMDSLALEFAAGPHGLRVIHVQTLPEGWMGKTHAMGLAAAQSTGDWLLFTDGDILYARETLARALGFAERERVDHLILYPTMIFKNFGERMMLSFLHALSIWGPRPWKVGDAQTKDYIGIGAFNLIRRPVYENIGGWGALRMEVLEDLRMGYTIKRAGYRQRAVFGRDLLRVRWAEGAIGVVNGMTKNLFAIFRFRLVVAASAWCSLIGLCLLPLVGMAFGSVAPLVVMLTAVAILYARFHRLGLPNAGYVVTFPVGAVLFLFALGQSILRTLLQQGVVWRGTFYPLAELRKHAGRLR